MIDTLISPSTLLSNYQQPDWVIVDCRYDLKAPYAGRQKYETAHIPGAVYAHLDEDLSGPIQPGQTGRHPLPSVVQAAITFAQLGIDQNTQVVAYDDKSGAIAARLWWMLRWLGHDAVAVLDGGWSAWVAAGHPVRKGAEHGSPRAFVPRPQNQKIISANGLLQLPPGQILVDSRTPERYLGQQEPIDPVAGHIPGAVNYPHPENVGADGKWLSASTIRKKMLSKLGAHESATFYCGSGVTACRNILAYRYAGLGDARLYPGSWSEWITDGDRPIAGGTAT